MRPSPTTARTFPSYQRHPAGLDPHVAAGGFGPALGDALCGDQKLRVRAERHAARIGDVKGERPHQLVALQFGARRAPEQDGCERSRRRHRGVKRGSASLLLPLARSRRWLGELRRCFEKRMSSELRQLGDAKRDR